MQGSKLPSAVVLEDVLLTTMSFRAVVYSLFPGASFKQVV